MLCKKIRLQNRTVSAMIDSVSRLDHIETIDQSSLFQSNQGELSENRSKTLGTRRCVGRGVRS